MYYKNKDYTVRTEEIDGYERYFLQFHGQISEPEVEIQYDVFLLYTKEFNKPFEKQKNEKRRHIADGDVDDLISMGKLTPNTLEENYTEAAVLDAILRSCTETQQKRFELYHTYGYSFAEIARIEKCSKQRVKKSVDSVSKKIKKYLF